MAQGSDEPLSQFVGRFTSQVQGIPDLHPSLAIQAFLMGLRLSRFFWSLIERPPTTLPEMLQRAHQYMAAETLITGKREETKRPRGEQSRGHPAPPPKRREDSGATKEGTVTFTGNTDTTSRNAATCSTKLKTLSANNPLSLTVGPPETRLPDLKTQSRSKSMSSSAGRPQAATAPRREKSIRDPRSGRGRCMTKTLTLRLGREARSTHPMMMR
ncbi:hypothetical protein BHE74_00050608 [Ensete ventricosum]|nr:hypothetical protein BHE74_00050608 [Ensete ventricosum]RZS02930.1 hypothetical protein BHM03_00033033 [Ensete ventricosum]